MADTYTGRFAPSPSGPLHLGSLISALASFLDARRHAGKWLLRIDDIDAPRCTPGMATHIQQTLERLGLHWDGRIRYQSQHLDDYLAALNRLQQTGELFRCYCPRRLTKGKSCPGRCRDSKQRQDKAHSLRVKMRPEAMSFHDSIQSVLATSPDKAVSDFIVRRADQMTAYNLAVVVDDQATGVTHIVRGTDLIDTTFNQLHLHTLLGLKPPGYAHHPVIVDPAGKKYSKQHGAVDILTSGQPSEVIFHGLNLLGQQPEPQLRRAEVSELLAWAIAHWQLDNIPTTRKITSTLRYI